MIKQHGFVLFFPFFLYKLKLHSHIYNIRKYSCTFFFVYLILSYQFFSRRELARKHEWRKTTKSHSMNISSKRVTQSDFRLICPTLREAAKQLGECLESPLFMLTCSDYICPFDGRRYKMNQFEANMNYRCLGSLYGWLAIQSFSSILLQVFE